MRTTRPRGRGGCAREGRPAAAGDALGSHFGGNSGHSTSTAGRVVVFAGWRCPRGWLLVLEFIRTASVWLGSVLVLEFIRNASVLLQASVLAVRVPRGVRPLARP